MDLSATFKPTRASLDLHAGPSSSSALVMQIPVNTSLTVSDGPVIADMYTWWQAKTADGVTGWFADSIFTGLEVTTPLQVYGYNVCDGFNIRTFGVIGWDSIASAIPKL